MWHLKVRDKPRKLRIFRCPLDIFDVSKEILCVMSPIKVYTRLAISLASDGPSASDRVSIYNTYQQFSSTEDRSLLKTLDIDKSRSFNSIKIHTPPSSLPHVPLISVASTTEVAHSRSSHSIPTKRNNIPHMREPNSVKLFTPRIKFRLRTHRADGEDKPNSRRITIRIKLEANNTRLGSKLSPPHARNSLTAFRGELLSFEIHPEAQG